MATQKQPANKSLGALRLIAVLLAMIALELAVVGVLSFRQVPPSTKWDYAVMTYDPDRGEAYVFSNDPTTAMSDDLHVALQALDAGRGDKKLLLAEYLNAAASAGWEFVSFGSANQLNWQDVVLRKPLD